MPLEKFPDLLLSRLNMQTAVVIFLSFVLQKTKSIPVSGSELVDNIANPSSTVEYFYANSDESRRQNGNETSTDEGNTQLGKTESNPVEFAKTNAARNGLLVPYLCDVQKRKCWLNQDRGNLVTILIPVKLLPDGQPEPEMDLKEYYLLDSGKKQLLFKEDSNHQSNIANEQDPTNHISAAHKRKKRYIQYSDVNDNLQQQDWSNTDGNSQPDQPQRSQRDVASSSTETSSTDAANKQSKRSADQDGDEEDEDVVSPSPNDDYENDDEGEYQPEKRFAGPETAGSTPKPDNLSSHNPSQVNRREAMDPDVQYPFFANPGDFYYPSQRLMSPLDGISYRSADFYPPFNMGGYPEPAPWIRKMTRNPQQYYSQRQAGSYGRGWPSYYQQYSNRYYPQYQQRPAQQSRGHYQYQHPQKQSYNSYKPFSYGYAQESKNSLKYPNYKTPMRKPIETDADMYYGK